MKNLAIAMADPFGDDAIDFKLEDFLASMFNHSVAHLRTRFNEWGEHLPEGLLNPLASNRPLARMASRKTAIRHALHKVEVIGRGGFRRKPAMAQLRSLSCHGMVFHQAKEVEEAEARVAAQAAEELAPQSCAASVELPSLEQQIVAEQTGSARLSSGRLDVEGEDSAKRRRRKSKANDDGTHGGDSLHLQ